MAYSCYEENCQQNLCVTSQVVLLASTCRVASEALEASSHLDTTGFLGLESCVVGTCRRWVCAAYQTSTCLNLTLVLQKTNTHVWIISILLHRYPLAMRALTCHLTDTHLPAGKRLKEPSENPTLLSFLKAAWVPPPPDKPPSVILPQFIAGSYLGDLHSLHGLKTKLTHFLKEKTKTKPKFKKQTNKKPSNKNPQILLEMGVLC